MHSLEECADCKLAAPPLNEEQTLRSTLGWRLTFDRLPDGTQAPVWRCPTCWRKHKAKMLAKR